MEQAPNRHPPGFRGQLNLLLWKNWLVHLREKKMTATQVIMPLSGAFLMLFFRWLGNVESQETPTLFLNWDLGAPAAKRLLAENQNESLLLYAPNISVVNSLINDVSNMLKADNVTAKFVGFPSESSLVSYVREDEQRAKPVSFALVFDIDIFSTAFPSKLTYKIRHNTKPETSWATRLAFPYIRRAYPRSSSNLYYMTGFLYVQKTVDKAIIKTWKPSSVIQVLGELLQKIVFPPYFVDSMAGTIRVVFPTVLMMSMMLSSISMGKNIVLEKENTLKEAMKVMGLTEEAIWTSWFLDSFFCLLVASGLNTVLMCVVEVSDRAVLPNSQPSLIFFFFLCYSMSVIGFTFFTTTLVNKATTGTLVTGIFFFLAHMPYFTYDGRYEDLATWQKLSLCLMFNTGMAFGTKIISFHESSGAGGKWSNVASPATYADNIALHHVLIMLNVDAVIFFVLAWYIDKVHPGEYGVPLPWDFPFKRSYWSNDGIRPSDLHKEDGVEGASYQYDDARFEREPSDLPAGIRMLHLKKIFHNGKQAVKDSTLSMFEGHITVLLGHNGAGKTTTMSMLTGFITPTSGTAYVNGYDIRTDIVGVRRSLGLCPQHNILFEGLTVEEHLEFFALLKGCHKKEVRSLVQEMATEVGLATKSNDNAGRLSGGQKRKLCVGIALIGGSKFELELYKRAGSALGGLWQVIILDEPTSGMDPAARRQTWETLQRNRAGRTILLTTHFMDEADILGDRIAIMADGVVECCGTPLFLKKIYGAGYHLVIVKGQGFRDQAVRAAINTIIATAELEGEAAAEISYLLPRDESSKFAQLFEKLELESKPLGISSFGVTATTMEEVFLKVGSSEPSVEVHHRTAGAEICRSTSSCVDLPGSSVREPRNDNQGQSSSVQEAQKTNEGEFVLENVEPNTKHSSYEAFMNLSCSYQRLTFPLLQLSMFYGMFVKKVISGLRSWKMTTVQISLPVLFTILPCLVLYDLSVAGNLEDPPIVLDLTMFQETITGYNTGFRSPSASTTKMGDAYKSLFTSPNTVQNADTLARTMDMYFLSLWKDLGMSSYLEKVVIGAEFRPSSSQIPGVQNAVNATSGNSSESPDVQNAISFTARFNGQTLHGEAVSLAYVMNAYARAVTGDYNHAITTINHPLPKTHEKAAMIILILALAHAFILAFCMLFGMAFLTASYSYFLIRERQTEAKHLQMVSGVDPLSFWLSAFAWDFITILIPIVLIMVVLAAFQIEAFMEGSNMAVLFLVLAAYGIAVLPYAYLIQMFFSVPASGFMGLLFLTFVTGMFTLIASFVLRLPNRFKVDPDQVDGVLRILFPHFCVGNSLYGIYTNKYSSNYCKDYHDAECQILKDRGLQHPCCKGICDSCFPHEDSYLSLTYPGVGGNILCMLGQGLVCFIILLALDFNIPQKILYFCKGDDYYFEPSDEEDDDVVKERQRVVSGGANDDTLLLDNVYKQYGYFVGVDHVFLGVPQKECFGLLGQNGAGKTTTFKILTGDVMLTSGQAFVLQHSIRTDIKRVQENMGYCPQFDALIEEMTARETLYMYARLRGVPADVVPHLVSSLISALMLTEHADNPCGRYSGGNKRKLSTAIALIGNPAIILLDEPTSGVDPAARRQLWNVLSSVRASGQTIILTSHSMEECEALCTRIAVMVNGKYKCLGSVQHLKSKFSQGFTVEAKMVSLSDGTHAPTSPLVDYMCETFPGTEKIEEQEGYITLQLSDPSILLSRLFAVMERCKTEFQVDDFSVYQTSLEQIFLKFTRRQSAARFAMVQWWYPYVNFFCSVDF